MDIQAVEFRAELRQIKTMADRTVNVTINLPEDCKEQAKILMDWLGLEIGAVIVKDYRDIVSRRKTKVK